MNISHLRSLVALADCGSFTAAAAALGVTQSGVSQAVAALEDALGITLVVRLRQGAELTAAGERIVHHARAALDGRMRTEAQGARGLGAARLRIAGFPSVFAALLPAALHRFRTLYPGITVTALEVDDREVESLLAAGKIDLGVVLNPARGRAAAILGRDSWRLVFPSGHRLARRPAVTFSDFAGEAFVVASGGCAVNPRALAAAAARAGVRSRRRAEPRAEPSRAAQAFIDAMRTSTPRRGRGGSGRDRLAVLSRREV